VLDDAWHHVVFVKDASRDLSIYVDGQIDTSSTYSNTDPRAFEPCNTVIGTFPNLSTLHFSGQIDEVFVFDEALGAAEIRSLYAANSADGGPLQVDFGGTTTQQVQDGWQHVTGAAMGPVSEDFAYGGGTITLELSDPGGGPFFNKRTTTLLHPIGEVGLDFLSGRQYETLTMTFKDLEAGTHYLRTYHHDATSTYPAIASIHVNDDLGTNRLVATDVPITTRNGTNTPGIISTVPITLHANGTDDVEVVFTPNQYTHFSGFELTDTLPKYLFVDFELRGDNDTQGGFQAFDHPSTSHPEPQAHWFFTEQGIDGSVEVGYSTSSGSVTPNDRGDMAHALGDLAEDFIPAGSDLTLTLDQLKAGPYDIVTYHHDLNYQWGALTVDVTDALGTNTVLSGVGQSTGTGYPAYAKFRFTANGVDPVAITFSANMVILNGFELYSVPEPGSIALWCLGLVALLGFARRKR